MLNEALYYRRTTKGLGEIQHKTHGLTQSERLILIIIDGTTSESGLREKLKGLAEGRFETAMQSLLERGLVKECPAPQPESPMEFLDSSLIARFLRQDPLDPVTVAAPSLSAGQDGDSVLASTHPDELVLRPGKISKVDIYLPLEPIIGRDKDGPTFDGNAVPRPIAMHTSEFGTQPEMKPSGSIYVKSAWVFFISLILLILFIVLQIAS